MADQRKDDAPQPERLKHAHQANPRPDRMDDERVEDPLDKKPDDGPPQPPKKN